MFQKELNCYYKCKQTHFRRFLSNRNNADILSDLFGLTTAKAALYIENNKLQNKSEDLLMNSINFCRKVGYTSNEILANPLLLRLHPLALEQHYLTLEEGGFKVVDPSVLTRSQFHLRATIHYLKSKGIIATNTNVPKHFLSFIDDEEIANKISLSNFSDNDQFNIVHKSILHSYLKLRLNATEDETTRLFRIHKTIKNKSFRVVQENIAFAEDLGFEQHKILKYGYILHNYPNYPKTVLKDFHNLAGANMKKSMRHYPKLVMTSPTNIIKIYGILKEFDIEDEVIRKQMNVFHMSPVTVKLRLEEIKRSPDFRALLKHPKLLCLIVHHNRAKSRLSFLQQLQLRCASIVILGTDLAEVFDNYIREGKDINKISDVTHFIKGIFNEDIKTILNKLKIHPYYLQVPLKDMQETYDYLINKKFYRDSIFKVLHILLYPREKVQKALSEIRANQEVHFRSLKQVKKLNLVLYFIEREYHFTGNGIWRKSVETCAPE